MEEYQGLSGVQVDPSYKLLELEVSMQWPAQATEEMKPRILTDQGQRGRLSVLLNLDSEEEVEQLRPRESCIC